MSRTDEITFRLVMVTPDIARQFLSMNDTNRTPRNAWVKSLARECSAGTFELTHQAIAIAPSGRVVDGQHRLMAIVESGVAQFCYVATYPTEASALAAMIVIDRGAKRELGETAEIVGALPDSGKDRVAVARAVAILESGARDQSDCIIRKIAESQVADYNAIRSCITRERSLGSGAIHVAPFVWARSIVGAQVDPIAARIGSRVGMSNVEALCARTMDEPTPGGSNDRIAAMTRILRCIEAALFGDQIVMAKAQARAVIVDRFKSRSISPERGEE